MPAPTHRDTLGVSPTATPAEVRRAFRRRAHELHPDRNLSPHAAADFRALRAAYDAVMAGIPDADGFDIEQIARDIEEAAREADRCRAAEAALGWQQVRVPLDRTARERARDGLQTSRGRLGVGAGVALAVAIGVGLPIAAGFAAWALVGAAAGLAAGTALAAAALWTADDRPWAVDTHWRGVRDLRWDATVEWEEIREVHEADRWLDLVITDAAARRLGRTVPPQTLVRLQPAGAPGETEAPVAYRLPLRESAPLAGIVRHQLATALAA